MLVSRAFGCSYIAPFLLPVWVYICVGLCFLFLSCSAPLSRAVSSATETEQFSAGNSRSGIFPAGRCSEVDAGELSPRSQGRGRLWGVPAELPCPAHRWGWQLPCNHPGVAAAPLLPQQLGKADKNNPRDPGAKLRGGESHILSSVWFLLHHLPRQPTNIFFSYYILI